MTSRVPVAKTYKIYVDGKFPRTESGRYFALEDSEGRTIANVCRGSRKDFRNAVVAARKAAPGWSAASAYLRGQILYRIAEMLDHRDTREAQIRAALSQAPGTPADLAARIYTDTAPALLPAAARNVLAHLIDLVSRGHAASEGPLSATARFALTAISSPS